MLKSISFSTLLLLMYVFWGCSGTYTVKKESNPITFTAKVGTATAYDIEEKTRRLLDRYRYEIVRFEKTYDQIYFETQWRYRSPFEDEYEISVVDARTRIIINARPRTRTYVTGTDLYVIHVRGENQVRLEGSDAWINLPMTDMVMVYLSKFAENLEMEFRTGIRKY